MARMLTPSARARFDEVHSARGLHQFLPVLLGQPSVCGTCCHRQRPSFHF